MGKSFEFYLRLLTALIAAYLQLLAADGEPKERIRVE